MRSQVVNREGNEGIVAKFSDEMVAVVVQAVLCRASELPNLTRLLIPFELHAVAWQSSRDRLIPQPVKTEVIPDGYAE